MYKVLPFCKVLIMSIWFIILLVVRMFTEDITTMLLFIAFGIWLWLYLNGLNINIDENYIIKRSGRILNRSKHIMIKNILELEIITLLPVLPGVIRIVYPGQTVTFFGFTGRQLKSIEENIISHHKILK